MLHVSFSQQPHLAGEERRLERLTVLHSQETRKLQFKHGSDSAQVTSSRKPSVTSTHPPLWHLHCTLGPAMHLPQKQTGTSSFTPVPAQSSFWINSFKTSLMPSQASFLCDQALPLPRPCAALRLRSLGTWEKNPVKAAISYIYK